MLGFIINEIKCYADTMLWDLIHQVPRLTSSNGNKALIDLCNHICYLLRFGGDYNISIDEVEKRKYTTKGKKKSSGGMYVDT